MRGRTVPVSTHRLQLEPGFTLDDAVAQVDHLAALGVSHLYLSPVLQAAPGSTHGYDVVDHDHVASGLGGDAAFERLCTAARAAGLGVVVDVVPNHMTTPTPLSLNAPFWSVLREGRSSPYAAWFDVDWDAQDGRILLPVLGSSLDEALASGDVTLGEHEGEPVVRYFDHVFPLAAESGGAPGDAGGERSLAEVLDAQHYRLAFWRDGATDLNYRRFFDVTSLVAVRVEEPEVFDATHRLLVEAVARGDVDGLRIDHPDGLADPEGYLARLAEATGGAWVVVEKILEGEETLPAHWATAGTTGYDALLRVGGLFVDPDGAAPLDALAAELLGAPQDLDAMVLDAKRHVVEHVLAAELNRLLRAVGRALPDLDLDAARRALEALLVGMDRYRVYVRPGEAPPAGAQEQLEAAAVRGGAGEGSSVDPEVLDRLVDLVLGVAQVADHDARADVVVRFQQTCGPVMAKAVEDTTFYRHVRLVALNEVGGDPAHVGTTTDDFHAFASGLLADWPTAMTTLSTHDTKRSEDVRARLAVLAERPAAWGEWVRQARPLGAAGRDERLDAATEYLLWQTVVGAWPITPERLTAYAQKAVREAKTHTTWTEPDADYEAAVERFAHVVTTDPGVTAHVERWLRDTQAEERAVVLGQKLVQLTMPGVPDVYQGTDLVDLSLVDPDNRRLVDYSERRSRLARLDSGAAPADLSDEKLLVTAAALRARREWPESFVGPDATYEPLPTTSEHAVAFGRGTPDGVDVVTVVTRLAGRLLDDGGFGEATVELPQGRWTDVVTARTFTGGPVRLADLVGRATGPAVDAEEVGGLPVALLVRVRDDA